MFSGVVLGSTELNNKAHMKDNLRMRFFHLQGVMAHCSILFGSPGFLMLLLPVGTELMTSREGAHLTVKSRVYRSNLRGLSVENYLLSTGY